MELHLHRSNRTVSVTGPGGGAPSQETVDVLVQRLTYYTRRYVHGSGEYQTFEGRLYAHDRVTGNLAFPLGMLPSVTGFLAHVGIRPVVHGKSLLDLNPKAHRLDVDAVLREFSLRDGQDECLAQIASNDGGVIAAATGFGKSHLLKIICVMYPSARIHIITKSADVARGIYDSLIAVCPGVGFIGGGNNIRGRVTVFVAASLHHGEGEADLCLLDECHELLTPKYAGLLGMYRTARMFGFTATPTGRHDGRDPEIEAICGPILYSLSYQEAEAAGSVVPMTVEWLTIDSGPEVSGLEPVIRERVGIWQNDARNRKIAERVRKISPDDQTLVMTATIDHAVRLKALLPDFTLCYAPQGMDVERMDEYRSLGFLGPDEPMMTRKRRDDLRRDFAANKLKKVISNYVWSTGVDFPHLAALIRADAGGHGKAIKDYQIPGRACRVAADGSKSSALVIDCWDAWDDTMLTRSRGRRKNYQSRGWAQIFQPKVKP